MAQNSIILSETELDNSLKYLEETTLSDFFPTPFELHAIKHSWDKVRDVLSSINMLDYRTKEFCTMTAPKNQWLLRPVKLLDPIDTILLTSLCFRLAPAIQSKKDTYANDIVFHGCMTIHK